MLILLDSVFLNIILVSYDEIDSSIDGKIGNSSDVMIGSSDDETIDSCNDN